MELSLVLLPLSLSLLGMLAWVGYQYREPAAFWWAAAGVCLALAGQLTEGGLPTAVPVEISGDIVGPLAAWLLYRGAVAYAREAPARWPALLALGATLASAAAYAAAAVEPARWVGYAVEVPICAAAALAAARGAGTGLGRLFAGGLGLLAVMVALDPWLRRSAVELPAPVVALWAAVTCPVVLVMACALLERRLLETHRRLRERDEQLLLAQRLARLGSWAMDVDSGRMRWSDEKFRIFGYVPGSFEPDAASVLAPLASVDRRRLARAVEATLRDGTPVDIEFPFRRADGSAGHAHSRAALVEIGGRKQLIGTTLDVSERQQARAELERYRDDLEVLVLERTAELEASRRRLRTSERLAAMGTLTAGIAHQINNPVAAILATAQYAQLCADRGPQADVAALQRAMSDIEREARRCGEIVHGLLRFARDEVTEKQPQALDPILVRALESVRAYAASRGARLEPALDGASPTVHASAIEIEQAIVNLLRNAIESRPRGARVALQRVVQGGLVRIRICDDGCGIGPEALERILDPFYTSRIEEGGTGLGLSVAHGIASEHAGALVVDSEPDKGTTVTFELPLAT